MSLKIMLSIVFLTITAGLHSAAGQNSFRLENLTCEANQTRDLKEVTYYHGKVRVGRVAYGISDPEEPFVKIYTLKVSSDYRLQGIGSFMLQQCEQDLKSGGCSEVRLEAMAFKARPKDFHRETERLVEFYKKNGFSLLRRSVMGPVMQKFLF